MKLLLLVLTAALVGCKSVTYKNGAHDGMEFVMFENWLLTEEFLDKIKIPEKITLAQVMENPKIMGRGGVMPVEFMRGFVDGVNKNIEELEWKKKLTKQVWLPRSLPK